MIQHLELVLVRFSFGVYRAWIAPASEVETQWMRDNRRRGHAARPAEWVIVRWLDEPFLGGKDERQRNPRSIDGLDCRK